MVDKISFNLGRFKISIYQVGRFKLDGGQVFGSVPKALWSKFFRSDELNRVELGINVAFIDDGDKRYLIDSGPGNLEKYDKKLLEIWDLKGENVRDVIGLDETDVDLVILTHLHFDHAGGSTEVGEKGFEPTFKKATYIVHEKELSAASNPTELMKYSYFPRDFEPLLEKKQLITINSDEKWLTKEIKYIYTGGHTRGHSIVKIFSEGEAFIFTGDLILTHRHIPKAWISGIDICKLENLLAREKLYEEALKENALFSFPHDIKPLIGRIKLDEKSRIVFEKY